LWSISALAVELNRDRRTVAKCLRGIPADGQLNGHDAWFLQTALGALGKSSARNKRAPMPTGFHALEEITDPIAPGAATALLSLSYQVGPVVASLAVEAGAPMRVAYALQNAMTVYCAGEAEQFCTSEAINPHVKKDNSDLFNLAALAQTDWEKLAQR